MFCSVCRKKKKTHRALELLPLLADLMRDYHVFCDQSPKLVLVEIPLAKFSAVDVTP